jgi:hypothetical protein
MSRRVISRGALFLLLVAITASIYAQQPAPAATVPPPKTISPSALPDPFFWPPELFRGTKLDYKVDLDLIAPLGNGSGNAALYFKDFSKGGARAADAEAAQKRRRVASKTWPGDSVLPADDPLLREAEPWVDQSVMRFYPNVWEVRGASTKSANFTYIIALGKSWISRGRSQTDPVKMQDDFRRVVRLGRLLRQDDVTLLQDLVGIALIRMGAAALYDSARREQDTTMTTLTALAHQDSVVMRLETKGRIEDFGIHEENVDSEGLWAKVFGPSVELTTKHFDKIVQVAVHGQERRFRLEALYLLWAVKNEGTSAQKKKAAEVLAAASKDADPLIAGAARYLGTAKWDKKLLGVL